MPRVPSCRGKPRGKRLAMMRPMKDCGDERRHGLKGYQEDQIDSVGSGLQGDNGVKE